MKPSVQKIYQTHLRTNLYNVTNSINNDTNLKVRLHQNGSHYSQHTELVIFLVFIDVLIPSVQMFWLRRSQVTTSFGYYTQTPKSQQQTNTSVQTAVWSQPTVCAQTAKHTPLYVGSTALYLYTTAWHVRVVDYVQPHKPISTKLYTPVSTKVCCTLCCLCINYFIM